MALKPVTPPVETVFAAMRTRLFGHPAPAVTRIADESRDPFRVLVSTMISLRTKDEVTASASKRLFDVADTAAAVAELTEKTVAGLIYPAGFYHTKARHIIGCARIIRDRHAGRVPATREELLALPGVGVKTANLTLNLGFGVEAVCVDTHVHRIANRLGWIDTDTPEASEGALEKVLPRALWIEVNSLFVAYGRSVCTPVSPKCSECSVAEACRQVGVSRRR